MSSKTIPQQNHHHWMTYRSMTKQVYVPFHCFFTSLLFLYLMFELLWSVIEVVVVPYLLVYGTSTHLFSTVSQRCKCKMNKYITNAAI